MPSSGQIKFIHTGRSKLRYQYAAIALAIGAVVLFISLKFETKDYLKTNPIGQRSEKGFARLWLDEGGSPVGASQAGDDVAISFWTGEMWRVNLGAPADRTQWIAAPDLSRLAWISGSALHLEPRSAPEHLISIPLPEGRKAMALTWLSDNSVAVVSSDASVMQWDPVTGRPAGEKQLKFSNPEQAAANQDYIALGSLQTRDIITYRYRPGAEWEIVERSPAPDLPFRLVTPGAGTAVEISEAGLHHAGQTLNTPGAVRNAAAHLESFLVTGDFEGAVVLDPDGERYPLAEAQPGALIAANETEIAVSDGGGTRLFRLSTESRLTSRGKTAAELGVALMGLAVLLCAGPFLIGKLMNLFSLLLRAKKKEAGGANVPRTLAAPPPELVTAFRNGEGVLWAGAGLSAQSGLPLRSAFVRSTLQTAQMESWMERAALKNIEALASKGDIEGALDLMVTSGMQRADLIAHFRAVYYKFVARSRAHEAISRMPLAAVITTNYDGLLDTSGDPWCKLILTLSSFAPPNLDVPFLLKLYGDLPTPPTVLLSRFEFGATFPRSPVAPLVRRALEQQTLLFVGCSLEGLLRDLAIVGAPPKLTRKHFAAVGVSGSKWKDQAEALEKQFGIRVLPCSEETISEALGEFLASLAAEIGKLAAANTRGTTVLVGNSGA